MFAAPASPSPKAPGRGTQERLAQARKLKAERAAKRTAAPKPTAAPARPSLREQAAAHRAKKGTAEERSRRLSDTAMSRVYKYDGMRGRNAATERNIGRLEALTEYRKSNNLVDPNVAARAAAAEKARAEQAPKPKPAKASKPKAKAATKAPSVTAPTSPPSAVQASVPPKSGGRGTPERLAKAARLKQWANNRRETLGRDRQTAAQAVQSGNPAVIRARILEMGRYAPRPAQDAGGGVILPGDSARRAAWKNRRSAEFQSAENRAIDVAYARRMSAVQPPSKPAPAPRPKSFEVTLERIGQNNAQFRGGANAYVAAVKGPDPKYGMKREFLTGNRDYGNANSVKSRGATETYSLPRGGVYEINEPRSWKNVDRYHVVARGTGLKKVDKERALAVSTRLERFKANRAAKSAPSLKEQAASHRAAKGDTSARLHAVKLKINRKGIEAQRAEKSNRDAGRTDVAARAAERLKRLLAKVPRVTRFGERVARS